MSGKKWYIATIKKIPPQEREKRKRKKEIESIDFFVVDKTWKE